MNSLIVENNMNDLLILEIKHDFLQFLNDNNNCYKYKKSEIENVNFHTKNTNLLLLIIEIIKKERSVSRYHGDCEFIIETNIIVRCQKLLKMMKQDIVNNINNILQVEKNIKYDINISFGSIFNINFDLITDINEDTLLSIYLNICDIINLKKINNYIVGKKLQEINYYLDCFRLFKFVSIN